jgi:hypothetical protein
MFDRARVALPPEDDRLPKAPQDADDLTTRVGQLRGRALRYRDRYGELDDLEPLERLDRAISRRVARIDQLQRIADEVTTEIRGLEDEITGIERGIEALLGSVLPLIKDRFAEAWSPTPVLGYRLWAARKDGMYGVRQKWTMPGMTAECHTTGHGEEVPHSDGRCGRLGCGIYAAKSLRRLLEEFSPALGSSFAAGLVGLRGKVIEHEHGYRAAEASVVAIVAVDSMRAEFTADPIRLEALFTGTKIVESAQRLSDRPALFSAVVEYLTEEERKQDPWT